MSHRLSVDVVKARLLKYNIVLIGNFTKTNDKVELMCWCGKVFFAKLNSIFGGITTSCGCYHKSQMSEAKRLTEKEVLLRFDKCNIKLIDKYIDSVTKIRMQCYCGKIFSSRPQHIFSGKTKSCGCYNSQNTSLRCLKNLTGQKFGRLLVLELLPKNGYYREYLCLCECGKEIIVKGQALSSNNTKSCGCLNIETSKNRLLELHKKQIGKNNPRYNPNLTDQDRVDRRTLPEYQDWIKKVKERDNWTCQVCGPEQVVLNSHHLYGYSYFKEGQYLLENGICLCKDCHNDFHYIYGRTYNTLEEFEEYLEVYCDI